MAKPFLEANEHILFVTCFNIDDTVRTKSRLSNGRREQIGSRQTPERLAARPCGNPGGKKRSSCPINCTVTATGDLMQRA